LWVVTAAAVCSTWTTHPRLQQRFGVQPIPTLLVMRKGKVTSHQARAAPAAALRSWCRAAARGLNAAGIGGCLELRQADAGRPPAHFNVDAGLLAAAIGALDDYAQGCNADNAADLSAYMRAAASRRASRCARHARTWPSTLAT
jgi:thioredoxin-like negative regulator of GroEL